MELEKTLPFLDIKIKRKDECHITECVEHLVFAMIKIHNLAVNVEMCSSRMSSSE